MQERSVAVPSSLSARAHLGLRASSRSLRTATAVAEDRGAEAFSTAAATVFVVDDNLGVRKSLRALLESTGLAVETYASSEEFLAAFNPEYPGCLVLDVRLRHGSGLDLQDELRRRKTILPIIVLTGYADAQTSARALNAGAFAFLQKPVLPTVLLERIGAAIDLDHRTRAATAGRAAVRRREVMDLRIAGRPSKEIAASPVSLRSVEGHRRKGRAVPASAKQARRTRRVEPRT